MNKNTLKFIFNKILELILTVFIITIISFILMRLSPIDAAEAYSNRLFHPLSQIELEALREKMGLKDSLFVQYWNWLKNVARFDFGISYVNKLPVYNQLNSALGFTLKIVLLSGIFDVFLILFFGSILFFSRNYKILHNILLIFFYALISIPVFIIATGFIEIFAVNFNLISVASNSGFMRYFPSSICFSIVTSAYFAPLLSTNLEKQMNTDCVFYARCRGMSERQILLKYTLPTATTSLLPLFFQCLALTIASSIIVEQVFSIPGLGYLLVNGVTYYDVPVIHACVLTLGFFLSIFTIFSDVLRHIIRRNSSTLEKNAI